MKIESSYSKASYKYYFVIFSLLILIAGTKHLYAQSGLGQDRLTFSSGYDLIETMDPGGSNRKSLANGRSPNWSPDGSKLIFYDYINYNPPRLVVVNADATNRYPIIISLSLSSSATSWFPDNQKILFVAEAYTDPVHGKIDDIFAINLDGTGLTNLTNTPNYHERNPKVSPDGQRILYTRITPGGGAGVFLMNANGTGQAQTYGNLDSGVFSAWSPDGTKIAGICFENRYVPELQKNVDFYTVCVNGNKISPETVVSVTRSETRNTEYITESLDQVSWSHDGSRLLYVRHKRVQIGEYPGWVVKYYSTANDINVDGGGETPVFGPTEGGVGGVYFSSRDDYISLSSGGAVWVIKDGAKTPFPEPNPLKGVYEWQPRKPCDCQAISRPQTQAVQSNWAAVGGFDINWRMTAEVSDDDGLVLKDIRLGERYMAKQISVPYYVLETNVLTKQHNELRPDGNETSMRSRLVNYEILEDAEKLVVEATYVIDRIPAGSSSCLYVIQRYEFYKQGVGDACEPSGTLPCSRWKPIVKYKFFGQAGQRITEFKAAQRQHHQVDNVPVNSIGLFKDCDKIGDCISSWTTTLPGIVGFERKYNPLQSEWFSIPVKNGESIVLWDNIHQTNLGVIDEPPVIFNPSSWFVGGGCPECVHSHWRWGALQPEEFGSGRLIGIPQGSKQDFGFAVVKNNPGEEDPFDVILLANDENIRHETTSADSPLRDYYFTSPDDIVLWYAGTGRQNSDTFFGFGAFFSAGSSRELVVSPVPLASFQDSNPTAQNSNLTVSEGITSIIAGNVYSNETTTITEVEPSLLGPLPAGYTTYNNLSFDVQTEAEISGPHTVTFSVPSVTDQNTFNNLRIFHAEQDPFEPTKAIWVDRTILPPDTQSPNFNNKTIKAKVRTLGPFVLASLTNPQPPNTSLADIAVTVNDSLSQVVVGDNITYTINITNNGPQPATDIKFADVLSSGSYFVSFASSQGVCTESKGRVVCKLVSLNVGASASVTVIVKSAESGFPYPPEGKNIFNTAYVRANENDSNLTNNKATETTLVLPDPNLAPTVSIVSPINGTTIVGPTNITLTANASDADGSINKVEFFDNGDLIGTVTTPTSNQYVLNWTNVNLGDHSILAIATDNLGKTNVSNTANIFVNGLAEVSITGPATASQFQAPANITINANASYANGSITKVDFYANGLLLGTVTNTGTNQYSFNWNGVTSGRYNLTAAATDNNGVLTKSAAIPVEVYLKGNLTPQVSIISPSSGSIYLAPASVNIRADATDSDGTVTQVDFYNNGAFVGRGTSTGTNQFSFTWNNLPKGIYNLTAVAKDNQGAMSASNSVNFKVNTSALFVTGSTTLTLSDYYIKARLENLGFTVTVKDGTNAATADANSQSLVVISSTVSPASVGTKFRNVAVPVVTWESGLFSNMGMTTTATKDYGTANRQTQIQIINATHPLASGLSGTITVYNANNTVSWGKPNANAAKVATVVGDSTKISIFGYATGSTMPGLTAPAKRVGLFLFDTSANNLNGNGWSLFDAAVNWAIQ